jgi:hypothetical protein
MLEEKVGSLLLFKEFVHDWLTQNGVPPNPEPEKTEKTGCRVGPRLEWLKANLKSV